LRKKFRQRQRFKNRSQLNDQIPRSVDRHFHVGRF
jgi:hypothetical protein